MSQALVDLRAEQLHLPKTSRWCKLAPVFGGLGIAGLLTALLLAGQTTLQHFLFSYLTAYLYWLSLALGGLFFVLLHFLIRANWSVSVRRMAENVTATLPLLALLALPLLLGARHIFPWAQGVVSDPVVQGKAAYLNLPFFYLRGGLYFAIWLGLAHFFYRWSLKQDRSEDAELKEHLTGQMTRFAPLGMVLYGLSQTFASFDWVMSLDPRWFSTMVGVTFFSGSVVAIMAFLAFMAAALHLSGQLRDVITLEHHHDLGKLLIGFVLFWAYIAFSQYLVYWYANIPEETSWYRHRLVGSWQVLSIVLAVGHFGVPLFFLMSRHIKRRPMALLVGAAWMLALHYIDIYWQVMPTIHRHGVHFTLLDLATFVGIGGLFLAVFFWLLRRFPLVPVGDPRLAESVAHENF
ncbi:MAG: quinol:cytochrome C oxidoreductase [Deltaproteobacteria bacterium]|nr:quinol:cytochrome C oxidoreductase [Deltaproteobacteria bacterium]